MTSRRPLMALDGVVPFPPDFVERYRAKGYWEDRSLAGVFQDVFATFAGRTALIAGSEHITYRELAGRVERLARHFLELGLRPLEAMPPISGKFGHSSSNFSSNCRSGVLNGSPSPMMARVRSPKPIASFSASRALSIAMMLALSSPDDRP